MSGKLNDKFLLASSIAGDEEAFGKLYDRYFDEIFRFIVMRVASKEEAQDIASEVFLKTWQYVMSSDKQIDNFRALLYKVARNLVIDFYRKSGKELAIFDEDQIKQLIDESINLEEELVKKDDVRIVFSALSELSEDSRELILMRYAQDLSVKEIANVLGKNNGAIRVALHRATKQLKLVLKSDT